MSGYVPSYMRARTDNYGELTNGSNGGNSINAQQFRRYDLDTSSRDTSADERSRSRDPGAYARQGGYGGFGASQGTRAPAQLGSTANNRSRGYDEYSTSRSRSRPGVPMGGMGASGQVEDILRYIEQQWAFMASPTCIPVKTALQLMDPSSLGLADQHDQFRETHQQLQNALKLIVNEHHQGFNSSIGTFHSIQRAIHASQQRVRTLRAGLVQAKGALGTAGVGKPELKSLAQSSRQYDEMLTTIATIEQLQLVPERLETQVSEKRFLGAVETVQDALKMIRKPELEDIGALSDLRLYLSNQEHSLTDILVEELHSHLYLKSPYCEERWKSHTRRDALTEGLMDPGERAMHTFLDEYDGRQALVEDTTRNPEADTFYYIQLLVESLDRMNKLDVAVDAIEHRLPVELFRVVERSHTEVEQRHPNSMLRSGSASSRRADHFGFSETPEGEKKAVLEDLLVTLYAKFEAIAEGHRVLHDVTAAILKRQDTAGEDAAALNRSFRELWKLLQSEIRSLLHDHLASDGDVGARLRKDGNAISSNIFKPQPRDRSKRLFKLADTHDRDGKASTDFTTEREDLEFILKSSVPGLVNREAQNAARREGQEKDDGLPDRSATGHKLLVEPSVFNMGILLPPSLDFLTRLKEVVPPGSGVMPSTLTSFLDDFLINVFYPQLDETLIDLCGRAMNDLDAFAAHPSWQIYASKPVFRGCVRFFDLIEAFCRMLDTLPHEQSFSQLVITQMRAYYDRCYNWSKGLLQRAQMAAQESQGVSMRLAADLATSGEINETVVSILKANQAGHQDRQLAEEEAELLLELVKDRRLKEGDLLNDRKALATLCTLHTSMLWLATRCRSLRFLSPRAVDTSNQQHQSIRRWTQTQHATGLEPSEPFLPLDQTSATQFDAVIMSFTELAGLVVRTLHIDLRLHLLHGVTNALATTYRLDQPYNDPDPAILALTSSLSSYDAQLSTNLLEPQYRFVTTYVDALVVAAFINPNMVRLVEGMDGYGRERMQLNVLVLQQCMKGLQPDATLAKAASFFALTEEGSLEKATEKGKKEGFDEENLKALEAMLAR